MRVALVVVLVLSAAPPGAAQAPTLPATDIPAAAISAFIDALPRQAVSDLPIRVVDVGGYKVGLYGVFRPKALAGDAILHETKTSEIYYILDGAGTLVTGGVLAELKAPTKGLSGTSVRAARIEGGVSRRIAKGDVVLIPGRTPHWWSSLEGDLSYLIFRPDPESRQTLK